MITDSELQELETALAAGTPAPWQRVEKGIYRGDLFIAHADPWDDCGPRPEPDAALIVALVNAAPSLLSELRRLREAEREAEERGARWALERVVTEAQDECDGRQRGTDNCKAWIGRGLRCTGCPAKECTADPSEAARICAEARKAAP